MDRPLTGPCHRTASWRLGDLDDLRDTYLTSVKGLPLEVLQQVAGHADIATTIKCYANATKQDADLAREAQTDSGLSRQVASARSPRTSWKLRAPPSRRGSSLVFGNRFGNLGPIRATGRRKTAFLKRPRCDSNTRPSAPESNADKTLPRFRTWNRGLL
jgi:hypothetical protein